MCLLEVNRGDDFAVILPIQFGGGNNQIRFFNFHPFRCVLNTSTDSPFLTFLRQNVWWDLCNANQRFITK